MPHSREEDFLRSTSILPHNNLSLGNGIMKFTFFGLLTLQMLHTKYGKDWPSSSWEQDVNERPMETDPNLWQ